MQSRDAAQTAPSHSHLTVEWPTVTYHEIILIHGLLDIAAMFQHICCCGGRFIYFCGGGMEVELKGRMIIVPFLLAERSDASL